MASVVCLGDGRPYELLQFLGIVIYDLALHREQPHTSRVTDIQIAPSLQGVGMILHICYIRAKAWKFAPAISSLVVWQAFDLAAAKKGRDVYFDPEVPHLLLGLLVILSHRFGMRSNQLDEVGWRIRSLFLEHCVQSTGIGAVIRELGAYLGAVRIMGRKG